MLVMVRVRDWGKLTVLIYEAVSVAPARWCTHLVLLKYLGVSPLQVSVSRMSSLVWSYFYFTGNISSTNLLYCPGKVFEASDLI